MKLLVNLVVLVLLLAAASLISRFGTLGQVVATCIVAILYLLSIHGAWQATEKEVNGDDFPLINWLGHARRIVINFTIVVAVVTFMATGIVMSFWN